MAIKYEDLPPQVQNQIKQMQQLQQQYEIIAQQRLQIEARLKETETAIEELSKLSGEEAVYKAIGNLIVKANKDKLLKELQEDKESLEIRKKSLESQESRLKEKIEELQNRIQEAIQSKG